MAHCTHPTALEPFLLPCRAFGTVVCRGGVIVSEGRARRREEGVCTSYQDADELLVLNGQGNAALKSALVEHDAVRWLLWLLLLLLLTRARRRWRGWVSSLRGEAGRDCLRRGCDCLQQGSAGMRGNPCRAVSLQQSTSVHTMYNGTLYIPTNT